MSLKTFLKSWKSFRDKNLKLMVLPIAQFTTTKNNEFGERRTRMTPSILLKIRGLQGIPLCIFK